jgi:hypothetical protein
VHAPTKDKDDAIKDSFYKELEQVFDHFPQYHMKILLGDEASNDNGVRVVNFATLKNLIVKSTTFAHRDIHKHTWTSPDGVTHNQIDHVLMNKR